jgi:hypothetical protein
MGTRAMILLTMLGTGCLTSPYQGQQAASGETVAIEGYLEEPGHQVLVQYYDYWAGVGMWRNLAIVTADTVPSYPAGYFGPDSPDLHFFQVLPETSFPGEWWLWSHNDRRRLRVRDLDRSLPVVGGDSGSVVCFWASDRSLPFYDRGTACGFQYPEVDVCAPGVAVDSTGSCWEVCDSLTDPTCCDYGVRPECSGFYRPYTP